MKLKILAFIGILLLAGFVVACSKSTPEHPKSEPSNTAQQPESVKEPTATVPAVSHEPNHDSNKDEIPSAVKAAFPEAQTISTQHKDLTPEQISSIEKNSGAKFTSNDFHSYIAYGSQGGKRTQLGAATLVDIEGTGEPIQLVVVYSNDIVIKKVVPVKGNGDVTSPTFLNQFIGKDHDQAFQVGKDIKFSSKNQNAAQAVAHAVKRDILAMQAIYGKPHSHH
ncbi:MAG: hypothetical protein AB1489_16235 [Acidobacteriota bacterium]